jgi:hypothetical protein
VLKFIPIDEPDAAHRRSFGDDFMDALQADFCAHGRDVIAKLRHDKPADYLKVIAALLPKQGAAQTEADPDPFAKLTDDDLAQALEALRALRSP